MLQRAVAIVVVILGCASSAVGAHERNPAECAEAGEFIEHAALSREAGVAREYFLERVRGDLEAIRAYPPALRWFAQDSEDEILLTRAVETVFDLPLEPGAQRRKFLEQCLVSAMPAPLTDDVGSASPAR